MTATLLLSLNLGSQTDVALTRSLVREVAARLGLGQLDQSRVATAVSEIARNAVEYASHGKVDLGWERDEEGSWLTVVITDQGGGIADLDSILAGTYHSAGGMGVGIVGARRLMDRFRIETEPGRSTTVHMAKRLPDHVASLDEARIREIRGLADRADVVDAQELFRQNQEILAALAALESRNRELQQGNQGLQALFQQVERLSRTDPLTDLPNRRAATDAMEKEWERYQRYGRPVSIIVADIDHFKRVNDTYGHDAGDAVLQAVARVIREQVRSQDTPARWGGEEFLILLPETGENGAGVTAERIRSRIAERPVSWQSQSIPVTASFGCATLDKSGMDDCVTRADRALYRAKSAGRNRVEKDRTDPGAANA